MMTKALTDDERAVRRAERYFSRGVAAYRLLEEGDRVLVALSGGKDSMALLELLARRSRVFAPRFEVVAAHVGMTNIPYRADMDYLRRQVEAVGVPFVHAETSFDPSTDTRKSPCFLCSWNRRKALFTLAHDHVCNKVALGHHMDDILETLLMNITFQGAFGTMPPRLRMRKFDMTLIRPLCLVHESDLEAMARVRGYQPQLSRCPYEHDSHRAGMKEMMRRLEAMNPEVRYSLWGSMTNVQEELLPERVCRKRPGKP